MCKKLIVSDLKFLLTEIKKDIIGPKVFYADSGAKYINWFDNFWLEEFIKFNFPNAKLDKFCFCSVDGKRPKFDKNDERIKIFFTVENVEKVIEHKKCKIDKNANICRWLLYIQKHYSDYMVNDVDLSLGFRRIEKENYLRFPYWLITTFQPNVTYLKIKDVVNEINASKSKNQKEAVCITRHDVFGQRERICQDLNGILDISFAGLWRKNTDDLKVLYKDNKCKYMNLFKFNICPENMDTIDYSTEKIFDALISGCIPIYSGCLNNPEPEIINKDFVILWDLDGDNTEQLKLVKRLNSDNEFYKKFVNQPKLKPDAADYIAEYFENLKQKLKELI